MYYTILNPCVLYLCPLQHPLLLPPSVTSSLQRRLLLLFPFSTSTAGLVSSSAEYDTQLMGITRGLLNALQGRKNSVGVLDKPSLVAEGRGASDLSNSQENTVVAHDIRMPTPSKNPSLGLHTSSLSKLARAPVSVDGRSRA